jgi:hypothetical protein
MTNHPRRSRARLARYGARLRTVDGERVVEMVDPNDNARRRYQYRATGGGTLETRILRADGSPMLEGSAWEAYADNELAALRGVRGTYHPILDPLGL